jgi:hypothetical protein
VADLQHLAAEHVVIQEIRAERARQATKWGEENHPDGTGASTVPLADLPWRRAFQDGKAKTLSNTNAQTLAATASENTVVAAELGLVTWADILLEETFEALAEYDAQKLRGQLVKVAALSTRWVEAIDRRLMDEVHAERADRRG